MKRLKKIPFFLLLLPLFFCLHGAVENYGYLHLTEVLEVGLLIAGCMAFLFFIIQLFARDYIFASLVVFFISLWYLFFGAFHDWITTTAFLSFLKSYTVLFLLLPALTILWALFLKRNRQLYGKLLLYINLLMLIYCSIDGFLLLKNMLSASEKNTAGMIAFDNAKVQQKPDVYYIVLDEYPGFKSLQDSFGFANEKFQDWLGANSFKVLPVFSNYDLTYFSMSSILNMNYVKDNFENLQLTQQDFQKRGVEIDNAAVVSIFQSMGYRLENLSIFDIAGKPALSAKNSFLLAHSILLTDKMLHNRMKKDIGKGLGKLLPFWKNKDFYYHDADNKETERKLVSTAAEKKQEPVFVYAHFMMPHGPYYYDSSGNKNPFDKISNYTKWKDKTLFVSYLKYINNRVQHILSDIISNDPGAVIVLMGDHGYREYDNKGLDQPYRYDNLCAVRFPRNNHISFKDNWSNVNLFRYIFNCEFGQQIPYLPDSSVILRY